MNTPEEIYRSFPDEAMMNNVANIIGRNGWDGLAATVRTARDALVYFRSRPAVPTASGATGDALKAWINQCREKFGHSAFDGKDQWWIGYFEALKDLERFVEKSASRPAVAQEGVRDVEQLITENQNLKDILQGVAVMAVRLHRILEKRSPNEPIVAQAKDYLKRMGVPYTSTWRSAMSSQPEGRG